MRSWTLSLQRLILTNQKEVVLNFDIPRIDVDLILVEVVDGFEFREGSGVYLLGLITLESWLLSQALLAQHTEFRIAVQSVYLV